MIAAEPGRVNVCLIVGGARIARGSGQSLQTHTAGRQSERARVGRGACVWAGQQQEQQEQQEEQQEEGKRQVWREAPDADDEQVEQHTHI